jgi:hypothetical protein
MVGALALIAPRATAAYTNSFDALRAELAARSAGLSNSTNKVDQKNKKILDKAIKAIDKPAKTLAKDIDTAAKIAKSLTKAFPVDFPTNVVTLTAAPHRRLAPGPTLGSLLQDVYDSLESIVEDWLSKLIIDANGLTDEKATTKALLASDAAQEAIDAATLADTLKDFIKALKKALGAVVKGQKIVAKAGTGGGGGSCGTITTSSVTMTASNDSFNATSTFPGFAGGEYTQSSKSLNVGGTDGVTGNAVGFQVNAGVTGPGTYTNVGGSYTVGSPPTQTFNITSGSMTINGLDLTAQTTCGTGTFTASDGTHVIVVTNFTFAIKNLAVSP